MPFVYSLSLPSTDSDNIFGGPLEEFDHLIHFYAGKYDLDPYQVGALIMIESGGNPNAVNVVSGATGLGQVMPYEAGELFATRPTTEELKDPKTNINWTCKILSHALSRADGDIKEAVFSYTGGWYWTKKHGEAEAEEMFERAVWRKFMKLTE